MKKLLLTFTAFAALMASASAQAPRMSLYEEFTGEDCGPCAAANPIMWSLLSQPGNNGGKVELLSFQEPIPHYGFLYYQTQALSDTRLNYYGTAITGTPTGVLDGVVPPAAPQDYAGDPRGLAQSNIDNASGITSPFTITFSDPVWDATYSHVSTTAIITAVGAYAPTGGTIKLRAALVESRHFTTAPGITGESNEQDFHDVVRNMYPDANGTAVSANWAVGDADTIEMTFDASYFVDRNSQNFVVGWIQNDADKTIAQAGKSTLLPVPSLTVDAAIDSSSTVVLACNGNGNVTVLLHNYGTTPLTAATIYTKVNTGFTNGAWSSNAWTGNLAPGATTYATYPVTGVPAYGGGGSNYNRVYDSVIAAGDLNPGNNVNYGNGFRINTPTTFAPINTGFEGGLPAGWVIENGLFVDYTDGTGPALGHNGSTYAVGLENFEYAPGSVDYLVAPALTKPATGSTSLDFFYAYAQQDATDNDALDVVTSTDCGNTWTSLWHKAGADLATVPASPIDFTTGNGLFIPSSVSDWQHIGLDISSLPNGSILAFKAVTDNGNILFIDDVHVLNTTLSVGTVAAAGNVSLYPNPAKENATLSLTLAAATNVTIDVVDAIGRTVSNVANQNMAAGNQKINISTAALASGIYNVRIVTDAGTTIQRLSVVK